MRARLEAGSSRRGLLFPALVAYGSIAVVVACTVTDTTITPATTVGPGTTSVSVDPAAFLFDTVCSNTPGAMQSYVATVTDAYRSCYSDSDCPLLPSSGAALCTGASPPNPGHCTATFTLPSSPPTSCTQKVYFEYINVGDGFTASIDGYDEPVSELVPACSSPGPSSLCHADTDCPIAYGCAGNCLVSTDASVSVGCLTACVLGDGGAASDFQTCLAKHDSCAATSVSAYLSCLVTCGADRTCLTNTSPQYCLDNHLAFLNAPCSEVTPAGDGGASDGGVPAGEVQACTCIYRTVEGSRQMYMKGAPYDKMVTPRWTTDPKKPPCGVGSPTYALDGTPSCPSSTIYEPDAGPSHTDLCLSSSGLYIDVPIRPCFALMDSEADAGVTAIEVTPAAALGSTGCTVGEPDGGSAVVTRFEVVPTSASLTAQAVSSCSPNAHALFNQGIAAGRTYGFTLQAYAGAALFLQSSCFATTHAGITVTAQCDPLVPLVPLVPIAPDAGITDAAGD